MKVIAVKQLGKYYNGKPAVDGIDFTVEKGEIFGFLGPNGAGKTTTINMLTGLARISSGQVLFMGTDYTQNIKKAQHLMGVVPDESNLYEELSGFDNLSFCGALYGMERKTREVRARELLDVFELTGAGSKPFKAYSKGMKRKLTIAAGIIHEPQILFLDEPTTGIDVSSARQIRNLILELNRKGTTIFLTTHYMEEAQRLCNRLAFIVNGHIIRSGYTQELMQETQKEYIVQLSFEGNGEGLGQLAKDVHDIERVEPVSAGVARIYATRPLELSSLLQTIKDHNLALYEARQVLPTLEEVFVSITAGAQESKQTVISSERVGTDDPVRPPPETQG